MPRRKPSPSPQSTSHRRQSIASLAARLMAEDGIGDYGLAKRKAARTVGPTENETLPSNEEVAAELRAYLALFQEGEHADRLRRLREVAVEAMKFLKDFRPYLTGAVLDGTAGRYAEVELELFADSAKDVEIFLLSHGIAYDHVRRHRHLPDGPEAILRMTLQDEDVVLAIHPYQAERQNSAHGRANTPAVTALLAD